MRYPIYLNYDFRHENLVGFCEILDDQITDAQLASAAIIPAVIMESAHSPLKRIAGWGMVARTKVDTRPHPELGAPNVAD